MSGNIPFNPNNTIAPANSIVLTTEGYIQGVFLDDPTANNQLLAGLVSQSEALPIWGAVALTETVPVADGQQAGNTLRRATGNSDLTAFSVFNQASNMLLSPGSTVAQAVSGNTTSYFRLGSNARVAVQCDEGLVNSLDGNPTTQLVSWDYTNQKLITYNAGVGALPVQVLQISTNSLVVAYDSGHKTLRYTNGPIAIIQLMNNSAAVDGNGTVKNVSAGNLAPLFTSSVPNPTTTPAISFTAIAQAANKVYAGPATGANAAPTFRSLVLADTPNSSTGGISNLISRDTSGNSFINNLLNGITSTVSAGATTTLTIASTQYQILTGTFDQTYVLPDATTLFNNWKFRFINKSTRSLVVRDSGSNILYTMPTGGCIECILLDNSTIDGSWKINVYGNDSAKWGDDHLDLGNTFFYGQKILEVIINSNTYTPTVDDVGKRLVFTLEAPVTITLDGTDFTGGENWFFDCATGTTIIITAAGGFNITGNTSMNSQDYYQVIYQPTEFKVLALEDTTISEVQLATMDNVDVNVGTKTNIYTVPTGFIAIITRACIRNASISLTTAQLSGGFDSGASNVTANTTLSTLTTANNYLFMNILPGAVAGAAADIFGVIANTPQGAAATVSVDVFGYLMPI